VAGNRWKRRDFQGFGANLMPKAESHLGNVGLNTGIGIVTPVTKIIETINQPRFTVERKQWIRAARAARAPVPDAPPNPDEK
jgi:hypothetical protein